MLTPEEWVRQNFIKYLIVEKNYPQQLISVEMEFKINKLSKRCDIVVFNSKGQPNMIIECKSHAVAINQDIFDQVVNYNINFDVDYLIVTNGIKHYCCKLDRENRSFAFIDDIPEYQVL